MNRRFSSFRIAAETNKAVTGPNVLHGILGSNGSCFVVNTHTGGWVTGPKSLFEQLAASSGEELLATCPDLAEPLLNQKLRRKTYTEFNPWTVKVADHCNMACTYCYEDANPKVKKMTEATAAKVIEEMLAVKQGHYVVLFHGGEPTLNMDVVRYMVKELRERCAGKANVQFVIHSNLLNFPDALHEDLQTLGVQIGTSLDGVKEVTDQYRVNLAGAGTYDTVARNLAKLSHKYLITTVTKMNHNRLLESARHFVEDLSVPGFHFLPLLPHGRPNVVSLCPDPETMADSMLEVFDYILAQWEQGTRVNCRNFDDVISALYSDSYMDACQACCLNEFKSQSITINYDGTFAPCDVSAGYPEYALGNIHNCRGDLVEYMNAPRNFRVFKRLENIDGCRTCPFKYSCAGGCEEESLHIGYERNHYCAYYYRIFAAVATNLYWLEQAGYTQQLPGVAHVPLVIR